MNNTRHRTNCDGCGRPILRTLSDPDHLCRFCRRHVAVTRARDTLVLVGQVKAEGAK